MKKEEIIEELCRICDNTSYTKDEELKFFILHYNKMNKKCMVNRFIDAFFNNHTQIVSILLPHIDINCKEIDVFVRELHDNYYDYDLHIKVLINFGYIPTFKMKTDLERYEELYGKIKI